MADKNSSSRHLLIIILALCITTQQLAVFGETGVDWWPLFGHDPQQSRYSLSLGPKTDTQLWSLSPSLQVRTTIVSSGILYIGSYNGTVLALNSLMGVTLWRKNLGTNWLSLAANNEKLFVGSMDGNLYALNAVTGEEIWRFKVAGGIFSSPTVVDNVLYLASEDPYCYALNADTGAVIWKTPAGGSKRSSPTIADGFAYFRDVADSAQIYALDTATGQKLWSISAPSATYADSAPAVVNGVIYYGSTDTKVYANDAKTGTQRWSYTTGGKIGSSPAVYNDVVFIGSEGSSFYALNAQTGTKMWEVQSTWSVYSSPLVADGTIYFGKWDATGYPNAATVLALDSKDGTMVWSHQAGRVFASPVIANGVLYVGTYDTKNIFAFGTPDGRTRFTAFNFTDVDEMISEGWTVTKPEQTILYPDKGVMIDGTQGVAEITYSVDVSEDIYDWKIDVKAAWLGAGHSRINIQMMTERHSYIWAVDGGNQRYILLRDSSTAKTAPGYTEKDGEPVYLTIMRIGNIFTLYSNGEHIASYIEPDNAPSRVTAVSLTSPADTKHQYIYMSAYTPNPNEGITPTPVSYTLTTNKVGNGSIIINPEKTRYNANETVQLTASPAPNFMFTGWSGDYTNTGNPITVTMTSNKIITATFTEKQSTETKITSNISNGTTIPSSRVTLAFENKDPRTSTYEVKVDDKAWITIGTQKTYTSSGFTLGNHTIQIRALDKYNNTIDATVLHFETTIWVPQATNTVASTIVSVVVFSAVSIAATAATSTVSSSSGWLGNKLSELLPEGVKGWLESYLASKHPSSLEAKRGPIYILTRVELIAYAVALITLTLAFSYAGSSTFSDLLILMPTVLATSVIVGVFKNLANEMIARALGVWSEHRVWLFGIATFTLTTLIFKTPFSSPSRIVSHSSQSTPHKLGLISSSSVVISLLLAAVFYLLLQIGYTYIGSIGLAMCLLMALFDILPLTPMNGRDIYDWNKAAWGALALTSAALYALWLLLL